LNYRPLLKLALYFFIGLFIWVSCSSDSNSDKKEESQNKQTSTTKKTPQQQVADVKVTAEENRKNVLEELDQYQTGLTYEQIASDPETYFATKGIFSGRVDQIIKGKEFHTMRLAIDGDYTKMVKVDFVTEASSRNVLKGDNVTVYGVFEGENTYTSTSGAKITLPQIHGLLIEIK
jgi:dtxA protein